MALTIPQSPATWNIGKASSTPGAAGGATPDSRAPTATVSRRLWMSVQRLRWVPTAPLGRPVVPEV